MDIDDVVNKFYDDDKTVEDKPAEIEEYILGIDLGTTNSAIAVWRNFRAELIPDEYGNTSIPSIVAMTDYSTYIGYEAKNQKELNPNNVFYEVKRLIGKKFNDEMVKNDSAFLSYHLEEGNNGNILICPKLKTEKKYTPEQITSRILMKLKNNAMKYLGIEKVKAVISVPAYFTDAQRQATKDASEIAGIECVRIINEPIASSLSYGIIDKKIRDDTNTNEGYVIVYDLGGGTLDVSLVKISNGLYEVLASAGNTHLGGVDFDNRILTYCLSQFKNEYKISEIKDLSSLSLHRLKKACERAKQKLSNVNETRIIVKNFYDNHNLVVRLTIDKFKEICNDLFVFCIKSLDDVLNSCNMTKNDINYVILVGGMTLVPAIQSNIKDFMGKEPYCSINPEETVAIGASIQGYIINHKDTPFSDLITILDSTPLSLGVETTGNIMDVLIPRNTVIPTTKRKKYTTDTDNIEKITIKIFEGERLITTENVKVGEFELLNLTPLPKGIPRIEILFKVDLNGILNVTAEELKLNGTDINRISININNKNDRLSRDEINKMIEEARESENIDRIERDRKEKQNEIRELCGNIIYNINDPECKLTDEQKEHIKIKVNNIIIPEVMEELDTLISKIRRKYGVLVFRVTKMENLETSKTKKDTVQCTSIYNDDDDDEDNDDQYGLLNVKEDKNTDINKARDELVDICYNVINAFDNVECSDIKDYINDILMWIHVVQCPTETVIRDKIKEVNEKCNEIMNTNNIKIDISKKVATDELEQICFSIKFAIKSNIYSSNEEDIKTLESAVDNVLEFLLNDNINIDEIKNKTNELNDLCNNIYNNMLIHQ